MHFKSSVNSTELTAFVSIAKIKQESNCTVITAAQTTNLNSEGVEINSAIIAIDFMENSIIRTEFVSSGQETEVVTSSTILGFKSQMACLKHPLLEELITFQ